MYEALDSVTRRVLIHYTATLTCSPSGWWQSWLRPSGYHSPAAVGWSGFPAAPSSAGTIQQQQQQQDSVSVQPWEECQMVWVPSCLSTWSVVLKKQNWKQKIHFYNSMPSPLSAWSGAPGSCPVLWPACPPVLSPWPNVALSSQPPHVLFFAFQPAAPEAEKQEGIWRRTKKK